MTTRTFKEDAQDGHFEAARVPDFVSRHEGALCAYISPHACLDRVENLLAEALKDLTDFSSEAPGSRCASALAEVAAELQAFAQVSRGIEPQHSAIVKRLSGLPARLRSLERLLASAGEFYSGWCAATPSVGYPDSCYSGESSQSAGWLKDPGPALLAYRG